MENSAVKPEIISGDLNEGENAILSDEVQIENQHNSEALQWLQYENQKSPGYEAKVPTSDRCNTIWKCSYAIEYLSHQYHTSALSNELYNFILAQGAQKLSAIKF